MDPNTRVSLFYFPFLLICHAIAFLVYHFARSSLPFVAANLHSCAMSSVCVEDRLSNRGHGFSGGTRNCCAVVTGTGPIAPVCEQKVASYNGSGHLEASTVLKPCIEASVLYEGALY